MHKVGHLEKKIGNNIGCATKEFGMQLSLQERRKLLQSVYNTAILKEFKYWKVSWKALELYVNGK